MSLPRCLGFSSCSFLFPAAVRKRAAKCLRASGIPLVSILGAHYREFEHVFSGGSPNFTQPLRESETNALSSLSLSLSLSSFVSLLSSPSRPERRPLVDLRLVPLALPRYSETVLRYRPTGISKNPCPSSCYRAAGRENVRPRGLSAGMHRTGTERERERGKDGIITGDTHTDDRDCARKFAGDFDNIDESCSRARLPRDATSRYATSG